VLVGENLRARGGVFTGESWIQLFWPMCGLVGYGVLAAVFDRTSLAVNLFVIGVMSIVLILVTAVIRFFRKRSGIPCRVLRLSKHGYRFGAARRGVLGILRPWSPQLQFRWSLFGENGRVQAIRFSGKFPLWVYFDLAVNCSEEQMEGLQERLRAWNPGIRAIRRW